MASLLSQRSSQRVMTLIQVVSLAIIALVVLAPLVMLFVASLKDDRFQILADMGSFRAFWVSNPSLNNFFEVLGASSGMPIGRFLLNSGVILAGTVLGGLVVNSLAAFVLAWGKLPGRAIILASFVALYIIPQETIMLPLLLVVNALGLNNGFLAQILPWMANPLFVFLFYQFFIQVPKDLVEAGAMDGASVFRIYRSIFLPLSLPVMAAVAILSGIDSWNMYLWPLLVTQSDYARPVSVAVASYLGESNIHWDQAMAASVLMMIPVLVFYLIFQKWFISSFMGSAVKG